jgi:hypothetical protein
VNSLNISAGCSLGIHEQSRSLAGSIDLGDLPVGDEGLLVMVLRLVADVISYLSDMMPTDGKCTVSTLPFKKFSRLDFVSDQMRRAAFGFAD